MELRNARDIDGTKLGYRTRQTVNIRDPRDLQDKFLIMSIERGSNCQGYAPAGTRTASGESPSFGEFSSSLLDSAACDQRYLA